jgi:hypothetical protein
MLLTLFSLLGAFY